MNDKNEPKSPPRQAFSDGPGRELLEKHHDFPGPYMFKVIGLAGDDFLEDIEKAVQSVLGAGAHTSISTRPSSGKRYLAATVEAQVRNVDQVLELYRVLGELKGLVTLV